MILRFLDRFLNFNWIHDQYVIQSCTQVKIAVKLILKKLSDTFTDGFIWKINYLDTLQSIYWFKIMNLLMFLDSVASSLSIQAHYLWSNNWPKSNMTKTQTLSWSQKQTMINNLMFNLWKARKFPNCSSKKINKVNHRTYRLLQNKIKHTKVLFNWKVMRFLSFIVRPLSFRNCKECRNFSGSVNFKTLLLT